MATTVATGLAWVAGPFGGEGESAVSGKRNPGEDEACARLGLMPPSEAVHTSVVRLPALLGGDEIEWHVAMPIVQRAVASALADAREQLDEAAVAEGADGDGRGDDAGGDGGAAAGAAGAMWEAGPHVRRKAVPWSGHSRPDAANLLR